jgi:hypothetical protein
LVELHRRDTEVEESAVDGLQTQSVERRGETGEILAHERDRGREIRRDDDVRVAVERDDRPAPRDDRAAVAAGPKGRVQVYAAGPNGEPFERFGEQDRDVFINRARAPW